MSISISHVRSAAVARSAAPASRSTSSSRLPSLTAAAVPGRSNGSMPSGFPRRAGDLRSGCGGNVRRVHVVAAAEEKKKLWGGRFSEDIDPLMEKFNESLSFDRRMAQEDIRGSQGYARALAKTGIITDEERDQLVEGLTKVAAEWAADEFVVVAGDEDIHTANERRLGEIIGSVAGRAQNESIARLVPRRHPPRPPRVSLNVRRRRRGPPPTAFARRGRSRDEERDDASLVSNPSSRACLVPTAR